MALHQSKQVAGRAPVPSVLDANRVVAITGHYTVKVGDAANDIVEMGGIPPNTMVVDFALHHTGIGGTVDAGVLAGEYGAKDNSRTVGNELAAAAAVASAGLHRLAKSGTEVAVDEHAERGWGIKFLAAPVVGKVVRATLFVVPVGF